MFTVFLGLARRRSSPGADDSAHSDILVDFVTRALDLGPYLFAPRSDLGLSGGLLHRRSFLKTLAVLPTAGGLTGGGIEGVVGRVSPTGGLRERIGLGRRSTPPAPSGDP